MFITFILRGGWSGLASRLKEVKSVFVFPTIRIVKIWQFYPFFIILSSSLHQWKYCSQFLLLSANENIPFVCLFTQQNTIQKNKMALIAGCFSREGVKMGQFRPNRGEFDPITTKKSLKK